MYLAQLYGHLGQIDKAEAAFKEALILQPGYIDKAELFTYSALPLV